MIELVRVGCRTTIAAPLEHVRSQFADLDHHIRANVHPKLRFEILERSFGRTRFAQEVRLLGILQRDVFVRQIGPDGSIHDEAVDGPNRGGSVDIQFEPAGRSTDVEITVALPVPRRLGWLAPVLKWQVRREVLAAAEQDRRDIEQGAWAAARRGAPVFEAAAG